MKQLLTFIILGLLVAAPGEILNQILARQNPHAFRSTMISYTVLLFIAFWIGQGFRSVFRSKSRALLVFYLLFGSLGLAVEWFLLGNAPVLDPFQVVTQPGMFTYWGGLVLAPCLLMEGSQFATLKRAFTRFFVSFSLTYLAVALLLPRAKGGIFLGFVIFATGTAALNFYYYKYFRFIQNTAAGSRALAGKKE